MSGGMGPGYGSVLGMKAAMQASEASDKVRRYLALVHQKPQAKPGKSIIPNIPLKDDEP